MIRYLVQHREQIFVKGYGFLSFAKNMGENIGKNRSTNLSGKCKVANDVINDIIFKL